MRLRLVVSGHPTKRETGAFACSGCGELKVLSTTFGNHEAPRYVRCCDNNMRPAFTWCTFSWRR